jgi:hypothetical protein
MDPIESIPYRFYGLRKADHIRKAGKLPEVPEQCIDEAATATIIIVSIGY